jgi:integrase
MLDSTRVDATMSTPISDPIKGSAVSMMRSDAQKTSRRRRAANGDGTLYHRKDGRWEIAYTVDGQRHRFVSRSRSEVRRRLMAGLKAREEGIHQRPTRETAATFLNTWLPGMRPQLRYSTWVRYEKYLRIHVLPVIGSVPLVRLGPQHVRAVQERMLAKRASPTSVHHAQAVLHRALEDAVRWGLVPRNVASLVRPPKMACPQMRALSAEQVARLFEIATGDRLEALWVLAATAGMRHGELLALRWPEVDLDRAVARVTGTLAIGPEGLTVVEPKTARSRRQIALTDQAVNALRRHRTAQAVERLQAGPAWEDTELVFCDRLGRPLSAERMVRRGFRPPLKKAELPIIRFHDLRHTAATLMLGRGIHPKVVAEMLGHATVAVTLDIYSHVTPDMQREAAKAMSEFLA